MYTLASIREKHLYNVGFIELTLHLCSPHSLSMVCWCW